MKRIVTVGKTVSGKTLTGNTVVDKILMEHPGSKCLIIDPKTHKQEIRYFVPNKQIEGKVTHDEKS